MISGEKMDWIITLDRSIIFSVQDWVVTPWLTPFMRFISFIGEYAAIWVLIGIVLCFSKEYRKAGIAVLLGTFFTMIVGFYIASNSSHSIILISNMLYGIENRNYLYRRIKAFLILIMLMAIFAFTLIIMVFGNNILITIPGKPAPLPTSHKLIFLANLNLTLLHIRFL